MHAPVHLLRVLVQFRRFTAFFSRFGNIAVLFQQLGDGLVGGRTGKERHGLLFEKDTELECLADEVDVDMGNLQPALRHGLDQTFRLQPWNCFPDRP
ncbi:hypothetical protein D3C72_1311010 [compost metagenome]